MTPPRVALASYPRSGNTWVRYLLEAATGETCGSVHKDRIMPRGSDGIAIKTHKHDSDQYARAIHLVRNPFDAIESHFHWKRDIGGDLERQWDAHVNEAVGAWKSHTEHWLAAACPVLRVRYEDLHVDTAGELRRILRFLERRVDPAAMEQAVKAASLESMRELHPVFGPRFFRRGQVGASGDAFSDAQRKYVLDALEPLMRLLGYGIPAAAQ
jgi:hypothetical protein